MKLLDFSSKDIGIDLGTANILITLKGKGIVLREPSVVAIDQVTSEIVATGKEAKEMLGRTPENIRAVRPMKDGVIADFTATGLMLKNMLRKVCQKYNVGKPRIVVGVPSGITEVEERAVQEAFLQAGAKEVYLLDEPIVDYLKKHENIVIGLAQAENLKIELGCAMPLVSEITKEIRGRDIDVGLPKNINISSKEIELAMQRPINEIIEAVINTLSVTPPELASDIMQNGIYLAGGGALIRNLDNLIAQRTGIKTYIADSPLECVAIGAGKTLENFEKMRPVIVNRKHWRA